MFIKTKDAMKYQYMVLGVDEKGKEVIEAYKDIVDYYHKKYNGTLHGVILEDEEPRLTLYYMGEDGKSKKEAHRYQDRKKTLEHYEAICKAMCYGGE